MLYPFHRPFPEEHVPTTGDRYAVNVVDQPTVSATSCYSENEDTTKNKQVQAILVCMS